MPYKSEAQRKYFNSPAGKAKIGAEEVEHWNEVSKGKELPEKAIDKALATCDTVHKFATYEEALKFAQSNGLDYSNIKQNNSSFSVEIERNNKPIYKFTYYVRERYGNKAKYVEGPLTWYSESKLWSYVASDIRELLKKRGSNLEPYNPKFCGEVK